MKRSALRQIIKEELLKELNPSYVSRLNGLVNRTDLSNFVKSATLIKKDLLDEGFETEDIKEFLILKLNTAFK